MVSASDDTAPEPAALAGSPFAAAVRDELAEFRAAGLPVKSPEKGQGELWRHLSRYVQALGRGPAERDRARLFRQLVRLAATAQRIAEDCGLVAAGQAADGPDDSEADRLRKALADSERRREHLRGEVERLEGKLARARARLSEHRDAVACLCRLLAHEPADGRESFTVGRPPGGSA